MKNQNLADRFRTFVRNPAFPCVGAKSALARDQMTIVVSRDITSGWNDLEIWQALNQLSQSYRENRKLFQTLVVIFEGPIDLDEHEFEAALWDRVQSLSDKDDWMGQTSDPRVSHDPDDPHFSLSFSGEAYFVVGLHPDSSRTARRFDHPTLVFNLHDQFVQLRDSGDYEKLRTSIIGRDIALDGDANPMLARHGDKSEASQYSGREVDDSWVCPFSRSEGSKAHAL